MKILLIGQSPSRTGDPQYPLSGKILSNKLAMLAEITRDEYLERFDRINLLCVWPGKNGKGDAFPMIEAKHRADALARRLDDRRVIFLGRKTALAFGHKGVPFLKWHKCESYLAAVLPHPSGINHWYNDKRNLNQARRFMRNLGRY